MGSRRRFNWFPKGSFSPYRTWNYLCQSQSTRSIQNFKISQSLLWLERLPQILQSRNILAIHPFHSALVWTKSSSRSSFRGRFGQCDCSAQSSWESNKVALQIPEVNYQKLHCCYLWSNFFFFFQFRLAVEAWGLKNCTQKEEWFSDTVTAVLVPSYIDSAEIVRRAWKRYNLSLGLGLNKVAGKVFRIGHLGNLNEVNYYSFLLLTVTDS